MIKLLIVLFIGLVFEAIGVVYLNRGLREIGETQQVNTVEVLRIVKNGATNPKILLGTLFEAIFFGTLLYLMSQGSVSFIWPLTSLGFVLTTVAARVILQEEVSMLRWSGVLLIMIGAGLITYSEKVHEQHKPPPSAAASAGSVGQ